MESNCPSAPINKKEYITDIGKILVKDYGKKKYYKPEEVKKASKKSKYHKQDGIDWHCWAMCVFSTGPDFTAFHSLTGETCDYIKMKTEMLSGLANNVTASWVAIPDLDFDTSWLDFGDVFGGMLEGIGEFIGAIFEGL